MRGLSILVIAALITIMVDIMIAPDRTAADMTAMKGQLQTGLSIHGVRVARPGSLKTFPVELVPLP